MKVLTGCEIFSLKGMKAIEEDKQAIYVCETCLKGTDGQRANNPVAVFYQPDPAKVPLGGSQCFGMFWRPEFPDPDAPVRLYITNAISALEPFTGLVADNGDVIYSRYRWDYRYSPDRSVWIDGGRDYTRWGGHGRLVQLTIVEDKVEITG